MSNSKLILYWIFIILLIFGVFRWGSYLVKNKYIIECFSDNRDVPVNTNDKNYIVNMPINTTTTCKNMCGPLNRCAISGENCKSDVDCFGCKPLISGQTTYKGKTIPGDNDAGKMTNGYTPTYSVLTTDVGTRAAPFKKDEYDSSRAPTYAKGANTWFSTFQTGNSLFKSRYEPNGLKYELDYPPKYTLSGEFLENGPASSNS